MLTSKNQSQRVPVIYRNTPLMPMTIGRANKYVGEGYGKFLVHPKLGIRYLKLMKKPSGFKFQPIVLGIDPGSVYDGFSIISKHCHHENFELIHNKSIKKRMDIRRNYRRTRRGRLRNRPCRFDSRIKSKMVPTIRSMYDYRIWLINYVTQLYPISYVGIEIPKFNFYKKNFGGYATQVMQGITSLVEYLKNKSIEVVEYRGYDTKKRRIELFGESRKNYSKSRKSFYSHCIDSYCLATLVLGAIPVVNIKTRFIEKIWTNRRELHKWKNRLKGKQYYKKPNGEILNPWYGQVNRGDYTKIRTRVYPKSGRIYEVSYIPRTLRLKKFRTNYGGDTLYGVAKKAKYKMIDCSELKSFGRDWIRCKWISENKNQLRLVGYRNQVLEVIKG